MTDRRGKRTTSTGRAMGGIADLRPGSHLCIIYHTDEEHRTILTEYLQRGLDAGERAVCIADAGTAEVIRRHLRDAEVDVATAEERNQLVFLTRDDAYMRQGTFDPQGMLSLLREEAQRALEEGFAGLRVTGEMSWALRGPPGSERLMEYETLLNEFFPGSKATGLCQYDARRFPPGILLDVLRTHPIAVVGTTLYENPYYNPPENLLTEDADQGKLNRWLATLERIGHLNSVLKAIRNVNQLIVRERDPDKLIEEACALLTETRGFSCAWIVLLDENGQPERWAGSHGNDAVEKLVSMWREEGPPHCAQKALEHDAPVVVEDTRFSCPECPMALRYGPASGVAVRLAHEGRVYGVLVLGVPPGLASDPEERDLLQEVAGDIAYALAMNAVAREQQELHTLLASTMESIQDGISILDRDLTIQHVNHAMRAWYAENEPLVGKKCYEVYQGRGKPCEICPSLRSVQSGRTESEVVPGIPGSSAEWLEVYSYPIKDPQSDTVKGVVEFVRDITERVRSQEAIQRSLRMLRIAGEMAKLGGWYVDLAENRVLWSDEVAAIHEMPAGFSPTVDEGIAFYAPEHKERIREVFTACARDGVPYDEELQIITGSGRRSWVRTMGEPVRDAHGEFVGVQGAFQDITEQKVAEEALQQSEERYRSLFEESPLPFQEEDFSEVRAWIMTLRQQGIDDLETYFTRHPERVAEGLSRIRILSANRAALDLHEVGSVHELEARLAALTDPSQESYVSELLAIDEGRTEHSFRCVKHTASGRALHLHLHWTVLPGHEAVSDRVVMSTVDETAVFEAQEALHRTQFTVDKSPLSIFWISPEGKFIYVNETAAERLGYAQDELLTMHVWDVDPHYTKEKRNEQWRLYQEVKELSFESEHRRRDGTTFPVRIHSYHLSFKGQEMEVAEAADITDQIRAESSLRQSEERFRSLFEESPVALFEEDLSAVKREMDKLRAQGVTDLDAYFHGRPEALQAWIRKIGFLTANRAAMELFGADSVEAMVAFTKDDKLGPAAQAIRHEFVELYAGNTHVEHEGQARDLRGNTLETVVRLTVMAGHEERLDRVLVSIHDVTPQVWAREEVARSLQQTRAMFEGAVHSLGTLAEMRDPYTAGHQRRVAELACAIANRMGLPERQVDDIRIAGLLHDIGKSNIPAEILNKPTALTNLEMMLIRGHPQASHDILKDLPFRPLVAQSVLQHHERLDGSGYPQGLTGDQIAPEARILAVADVVEAMASHRPYRPALGLDKALEEIQTHRGTLYDPDAVDACVELFAEGFVFKEDGEDRLPQEPS